MNVIARANRQATQEQWNVPQVSIRSSWNRAVAQVRMNKVLDDSPPVINIAMMTETASDKKTRIADIGRAEEAFLLQGSRDSCQEALARHMNAR